MAFLNKSIEDSLKLIGGSSDTPTSTIANKPKRKRGRPRKNPIQVPAPSPVRQQSPATKFSPFRTNSRPSSPISLQRTPEAEERIVPPVTPTADDERSDDEPDLPQMETKNITVDLKSKYFKVIRYIQDGRNLIYAVSYDPNGQVVYIELNSEDVSSVSGVQLTHVKRQDYIEYPFALKDYYKNKINGHIYGVVLTRGENMCFLTKTDNGDIIESYYGSTDSFSDRINCYCVFRYTDVMEDLEASLQSVMYTYEMIQQHQLVTNKIIFKDAMEEINKLYIYSQEFDKIYKKFTESILDDWSRFSNVSVDYIDKLIEEGLTDEEKEKFSHISTNLFARFQSFNNISNAVEELKIVGNSLLPIKNILKESIDQFEKDNNKMAGRILDPSEVDVLL